MKVICLALGQGLNHRNDMALACNSCGGRPGAGPRAVHKFSVPLAISVTRSCK